MAQITITIPDARVPRFRAAMAARFGYQPKITDPATGQEIDNPESRADFALRMVRRWIKEQIVEHERMVAGNTAAAAAAAAADSEIDLT